MLDPIITNAGEGTIHRRDILGFLQISANYLGLADPLKLVDTNSDSGLSDAFGTGYPSSGRHASSQPSVSLAAAHQKYEPVV